MQKPYVKNKSHQCIFSIVMIPEKNGMRIYVAWEWEAAAKEGYYQIYKSKDMYNQITTQAILDTMNHGQKITNDKTPEIFPHLFKN